MLNASTSFAIVRGETHCYLLDKYEKASKSYSIRSFRFIFNTLDIFTRTSTEGITRLLSI